MRAKRIILLLVIAIAVSGCLSGGNQSPLQTAPPDFSEPKENSGAGVTVRAVYIGNSAFNISLDTHSGSLDYEMEKISYVRDWKGNIIKPKAWDGGIGGHHFRGTLLFPKFDESAGFELVIQGVGGVEERVLKW